MQKIISSINKRLEKAARPRGKNENIGEAIVKYLADDYYRLEPISPQDWVKIHEFITLCDRIQDLFMDATGMPCLFVGGDGVVSTQGKSGGNDVDDIDPKKLVSFLKKLEALKIPVKTKPNTPVKKTKVGSCYVYTEGWHQELQSISLSIECPAL